MPTTFTTPQDAEDAYYDAIDEADMEAMTGVWEESEEVLCLLPMLPAYRGSNAVLGAWGEILGSGQPPQLQIRHLTWIEHGDLAIHLVEEMLIVPQQPPHPIYATNIYRKGDDGWRLLVHQNSPTPPPPELQMPERS